MRLSANNICVYFLIVIVGTKFKDKNDINMKIFLVVGHLQLITSERSN